MKLKHYLLVGSLVISSGVMNSYADYHTPRSEIRYLHNSKKSELKYFKNNLYELFCLLDLSQDDNELTQAKKGILVEVNGNPISHHDAIALPVRGNKCTVRVTVLKQFPMSLRNKIIDLLLNDSQDELKTLENPNSITKQTLVMKFLKFITKYISVSFTFDYQINPDEQEYLLADILVAHKLPHWNDNGFHWKTKWESLQTIGFIIHDKEIDSDTLD
jgi:hypothetical protein